MSNFFCLSGRPAFLEKGWLNCLPIGTLSVSMSDYYFWTRTLPGGKGTPRDLVAGDNHRKYCINAQIEKKRS